MADVLRIGEPGETTLFGFCYAREIVIQGGLPRGRFLGFVVAENTLKALLEDTLLFTWPWVAIIALSLRFVMTHNALLILPSKHTPKGEPKDRFQYGFMDFPQDRIEAQRSAVRGF